jgi:hypothetical protein
LKRKGDHGSVPFHWNADYANNRLRFATPIRIEGALSITMTPRSDLASTFTSAGGNASPILNVVRFFSAVSGSPHAGKRR